MMKAGITLGVLTLCLVFLAATSQAETFAGAGQDISLNIESATGDVDYENQQVGYLADLVREANSCCCCCKSCCSCGCCGYDSGVYADIEFMFLRKRSETTGGSFSPVEIEDDYNFSPRVVVGYEGCRGWGIRSRYWSFDHDILTFIPTDLNPIITYINWDWDVWDIEGTKRVHFRNTDLVMAGGLRAGRAAITDGTVSEDCNFVGGTLAADLETILFSRGRGRWSAIYGGRLSLLSGDWKSTSGTVIASNSDWVVTEAYLGLQYSRTWRGKEVHAFVKGEYQQWDSDQIDDIEFYGPSLGLGVHF